MQLNVHIGTAEMEWKALIQGARDLCRDAEAADGAVAEQVMLLFEAYEQRRNAAMGNLRRVWLRFARKKGRKWRLQKLKTRWMTRKGWMRFAGSCLDQLRIQRVEAINLTEFMNDTTTETSALKLLFGRENIPMAETCGEAPEQPE
jgi:hypothetical protein